jgi:hypothetical protein
VLLRPFFYRENAMPKISEQFYQDGDKLVHVKQHDYTPALEQAAFMRENGNATFGESVCIGVIDRALMAQWLKEAGVKSDDPAAEEVLKRKMLSGEFDKFRVWDKNY